MKTPRYKFDELWLHAIHLTPYLTEEYTERLIRDYIEKGRDVDGEFSQTHFECAWVLIKAQIDARKSRNDRARAKRRACREKILAEKARRQAIEEARIDREEAARKAEAEAAAAAKKERNRLKRERHVDRTNCISSKSSARRAKNTQRLATTRPGDSFRANDATASITASDSSLSTRGISSSTVTRQRFSDRFRGPAYRKPVSRGSTLNHKE